MSLCLSECLLGMSMSICLFFCKFVSMSVYLSLCLSDWVCPYVCLFSVSFSSCLSVCLSTCLYIYQIVSVRIICLSTCLYIYQNVSFRMSVCMLLFISIPVLISTEFQWTIKPYLRTISWHEFRHIDHSWGWGLVSLSSWLLLGSQARQGWQGLLLLL